MSQDATEQALRQISETAQALAAQTNLVKHYRAEIEALRAEVASWKAQAMHNLDLVDRLAEALRELSQCDGSPANVLNAEVLAGRVRSIATKALRDHDQEVGNE